MKIVVGDSSIENIIREQYILASKANISISESSLLPDFEREAYINLILAESKQLEK